MSTIVVAPVKRLQVPAAQLGVGMKRTYLKDVLFDKRLIERHLQEGLIEPAELAKHIQALPDSAKKMVAIDETVLNQGTPPSALRSVLAQKIKARREAKRLGPAPMRLEDTLYDMSDLEDAELPEPELEEPEEDEDEDEEEDEDDE